MHVTAIILAGGRGSRMNSNVPKQYMDIGGRSLLHYTIKAFDDSVVDDIVIVRGIDDELIVNDVLESGDYKTPIRVTIGGEQRYDSVYNGLLMCRETDYVLIHDGARCCISTELINRIVERGRNSIVAVPVKDTIKKIDPDGKVNSTLNRAELYSVQTPQSFIYEDIFAAHERFREALAEGRPESIGVTDDSMVMERFSDKEIYLIEGEDTNVKVTTPSDLDIVKRYILG